MDKFLHFSGIDIVNPDIVIVRDGDAYRLLHGHLRLANVMRATDEIEVEVKGEGPVKIRKTGNGYTAGTDGRRVPLCRD
ncbi:hypothetical protein [Noviherbaspirillum denitrificans]|uniref:Uncharacterized protein n=1 Tax=Noviherbaspirillum denitrificans TaxID=1968433 RepID=A0A254TI55_9BURK|nr:hypothetical protein [Noviherbaspirillum denitrificans]OWW21887.1 hypothetical protein AYR66_22725 [Noviherbaspirillum denitrificans]